MNNMKAVYKLNFDCGRQGSLTGVFVADTELVEILMEKEIQVYFGEVLGKHSEVYGSIDEGEIIEVSRDPAVVSLIQDNDLETGYNPFEYSFTDFDYEEHGLDEEKDYCEEVQELCEKLRDLE